MGKVYSAEQVFAGCVPSKDGSDHIKAAQEVLNKMRDRFPMPNDNTGVVVFGSTTTGHANRRSDLDIAAVYRHLTDGSAETLKEAMVQASQKYNVTFELQAFHVDALRSPITHNIGQFFGSHLLGVQDTQPEWAFGTPFEPIRDYVIDEKDVDTDIEGKVLSEAADYMHYKMRQLSGVFFGKDGNIEYGVFQRALEMPKALGRKALMIAPLMGQAEDSLDVTVTSDMHRAYRRVAAEFGMEHSRLSYERLAQLNREYDDILEDALASNSPERAEKKYQQWIGAHYMQACRTAHDLAQQFSSSVFTFADKHAIRLEDSNVLASRS